MLAYIGYSLCTLSCAHLVLFKILHFASKMKLSIILSVSAFTLLSTVSSLPGGVQFVPNNNPFLLYRYAEPASRSIITPLQYQVSSVLPLPLGLRIVQQPVLAQTTVLRTQGQITQNLPNTIITRVIPNNLNSGGGSFINLRSQNTVAARPVFRNEEQNDAVVIDAAGNENIPGNVPIQENEIGSQQTPSQSYGYGVPVQPQQRFVLSNRILPQQALRSSYGAPIQQIRNVNVVRQRPQSAEYEIQKAHFVAELRSAIRGPVVLPVQVLSRNTIPRNRNGHQLSRQNISRQPARSASHQQIRSQGGYSGGGASPVRSGNNLVQFYTVKYN